MAPRCGRGPDICTQSILFLLDVCWEVERENVCICVRKCLPLMVLFIHWLTHTSTWSRLLVTTKSESIPQCGFTSVLWIWISQLPLMHLSDRTVFIPPPFLSLYFCPHIYSPFIDISEPFHEEQMHTFHSSLLKLSGRVNLKSPIKRICLMPKLNRHLNIQLCLCSWAHILIKALTLPF